MNVTFETNGMTTAALTLLAQLLEHQAAEGFHLSGAIPAEFEGAMLDRAQGNADTAALIRDALAARQKTAKRPADILTAGAKPYVLKDPTPSADKEDRK